MNVKFGASLVVGARLALSATGAHADAIEQLAAQCSGHPITTAVIEPCTAVIGSGRVEGHALAAAYGNRGTAYLETQEFDKAIADFTKAIGLDDTLVSNRVNRAYAYRAIKNFDAAIADLDAAIRIQPNATQYVTRGAINGKLARYDASIADFTSALTLAPANVEALQGRGYAYFETRHYADAFRDFDRAIQIDPNSATAYVGRGQARMYQNEPDKAVQDFDQALRLQPNDAPTLARRGLTLITLNRYDEAIADLNRANALGPGNSGNLQALCWAESASGRPPDQVIEDCNKALAAKPDSPVALKWRALALFRVHKYPKAMADLNRALAQLPRDAPSLYLRGVAEHRVGDTAKGDQDIAAAKAIDPSVDKFLQISNP